MPKGQNLWPESYRKIVGLRLKALVQAVQSIESKSASRLLRDIGIPSNRWGNVYNGSRPADVYDCVKFIDRYGGSTDWIFRGDIKSITDKRLRDATYSHFQTLLAGNPDIHAA